MTSQDYSPRVVLVSDVGNGLAHDGVDAMSLDLASVPVGSPTASDEVVFVDSVGATKRAYVSDMPTTPADDTVTASKLTTASVTTTKLAAASVTTEKVAANLRNWTAYQVCDVEAVSNTTALSNLIAYTVPANTLGENGAAIIRASGYVVNNTTGSSNLNVAIAWGGLFIFYDWFTIVKATTYRVWDLECRIQSCGATNKQWITMKGQLSSTLNATIGQGDLDVADVAGLVQPTQTGSFLTVDTTSAQQVALIMSWSSAAVNRTYKCQYGEVEIRGGA
jgi:hypothetical protein